MFHFTEGAQASSSHIQQHLMGRQHFHHVADVGQKAVQHHIPCERKASCGFWNAKYQALFFRGLRTDIWHLSTHKKKTGPWERGASGRNMQDDWTYRLTFYFIYDCFYEKLYEIHGDIRFKRIINVIILTRELINHWHLSKKSLKFYYFIINIMKRLCLPSLAINQASGMYSSVKELNIKPESIWFWKGVILLVWWVPHIISQQLSIYFCFSDDNW